jgi:hypothetical protein
LSGQTDRSEKGENAVFHFANLVIVGWVVKKITYVNLVPYLWNSTSCFTYKIYFIN